MIDKDLRNMLRRYENKSETSHTFNVTSKLLFYQSGPAKKIINRFTTFMIVHVDCMYNM